MVTKRNCLPFCNFFSNFVADLFGNPVKKEPIKKEPIKKEPIKKEPIKKEPIKIFWNKRFEALQYL